MLAMKESNDNRKKPLRKFKAFYSWHYDLFALMTTLCTTTILIIKKTFTKYDSNKIENFQTLTEFNHNKSTNEIILSGNSGKKEKGGINEELEEHIETNAHGCFNYSGFNPAFKNFQLTGKKIFSLNSTTIPENLEALVNLFGWGKMIQDGKWNRSFFSNNFDGNSSERATFMLLKGTQIKNKHLKKFGKFSYFYHGNEKETCNRCASELFTKENIKATTLADLKRELKNQFPRFGKEKEEATYIFMVKLFNCLQKELTAHVAVLVIHKNADLNSYQAYYCDSEGSSEYSRKDNSSCIPKLLYAFLIDELKIEAKNINYSSFEQQIIESFCTMFLLENSIIISDSMIKGKDPREIQKKLSYRPSPDGKSYLLKVRKNFMKHFGNGFCESFINEASFFQLSIENLLNKLEKHSLSIENSTSIDFLMKKKEELYNFAQFFKKERKNKKKISEVIVKPSYRKFETSVTNKANLDWASFCLICFFELKSKYYKHLESEWINQLKEIQSDSPNCCHNCKEILEEKISVKSKKKEYFLKVLNYVDCLLEKNKAETKPLNSFEAMLGQIKRNKKLYPHRTKKKIIKCTNPECKKKWTTKETLLPKAVYKQRTYLPFLNHIPIVNNLKNNYRNNSFKGREVR